MFGQAGRALVFSRDANEHGAGDVFGRESWAHRLELRTLVDYVRLYGDRRPEFEPGSRWRYSKYGYILLGTMIEKVTGQACYDYLQAHSHEPAQMTATGSQPDGWPVPDRSAGYMQPPGASGCGYPY